MKISYLLIAFSSFLAMETELEEVGHLVTSQDANNQKIITMIRGGQSLPDKTKLSSMRLLYTLLDKSKLSGSELEFFKKRREQITMAFSQLVFMSNNEYLSWKDDSYDSWFGWLCYPCSPGYFKFKAWEEEALEAELNELNTLLDFSLWIE